VTHRAYSPKVACISSWSIHNSFIFLPVQKFYPNEPHKLPIDIIFDDCAHLLSCKLKVVKCSKGISIWRESIHRNANK
jgi:hypothetical protein